MNLLVALLPNALDDLLVLLRIDTGELLRRSLEVLLIWIVIWLGNRVVKLVARRIELAVDDGDDSTLTEAEQRGRTISELLRSVGRVIFLVLGLMLTLNVFIDIGPILAGAGILGLAVSFGAQSLVKDIISGFFFLIEGQFAVGDVIEVAGKSGVVERMTLRVVMLRDSHGTLHMVPNGTITTVSNMTRKWSRAVVDVGIAYDTNVDQAIEIFMDEATRFAQDKEWAGLFDGTPEVVGVNDLGESQVTIRTLLKTLPGKQWAVGREFRRRIKNRLDKEGIEIPFPQRTMHVRISPPGAMEPAEAAKLLEDKAPA
ncbi:MAG TPA: mechanosensitive ion channel family protein [Gemmatimonadales bacterium]|nr:mechanosensitive ion channel family protein [Gemmatimonadales bacterium]